MAEGQTLGEAHRKLDYEGANLLTWHLRHRTPAPWLSRVLTESGIPTSQTTIKVYRAWLDLEEQDPVPDDGEGTPNEDLTLALATEKKIREDMLVSSSLLKILIVDIERIKGLFSGDFFDLGDLKYKSRIPVEWVTQWPRTICVAGKWYDSEEVLFTAEWFEGGHEQMVKTVWEWLDEADIVVGHNVRTFDLGHLNTAFLEYGLPEPSHYKVVDTLTVARNRFKFESNKLSALCDRLGVPSKTDHYDAEVAKAAVDGDTEAQKRLGDYNVGDIWATQYLYDKFRLQGWINNHPAITLALPLRCDPCGSGDLVPLPKPYLANVIAYDQYRCANCGTPHRARKGKRFKDVKATRSR